MKNKILIALFILVFIAGGGFGIWCLVQPKNCEFNFIVVDNVYYTTSVNSGGNLTIPDNPEQTNWVFDGWYYDEGIWEEPIDIDNVNTQTNGESAF